MIYWSTYTFTITHENEHYTLHVLPFLQLSEGIEQKLDYMHPADIVTHRLQAKLENFSTN